MGLLQNTITSLVAYASLKCKGILDASLYTKLFDSIVKPICLYGSQIWVDRLLKYVLNKDFGDFDAQPFEQVQNKLCRYALKVGKNTSNLATRSELGRYPLIITIAALTVKYWAKLLQTPNKLAYQAYQENIQMDERGQNTWVTVLRAILNRCNLYHLWESQTVRKPDEVVKVVTTTLRHQYEHVFFAKLNSTTGTKPNTGNKLRTYAKIKNQYQPEPYLIQGLPTYITRPIARIRVSAHELEIERGRWRRPRVPAEERHCRHCRDMVEDEEHFIVHCPLYEPERQQMLRQFPDTAGLTAEGVFKSLFTSHSTAVLTQLGVYIRRAMAKRATLL